MTYTIKELSPEDRPRERLAAMGPAALSNSELLAILIGSGTKEKSALHLAEDLTVNDGLYTFVAKCQRVQELAGIKGIGTSKASRILAAVELGKRIACASAVETEQISSPMEGAQYLMGKLRHETHEKFLVMLLNTKNRIIKIEQISEGSLNSAIVHPREVFALAIVARAACILVGHNHPSGDPRPSGEDRSLTRALVQTGGIIGIPLLDHVIIGDGRYYSFKEQGEL